MYSYREGRTYYNPEELVQTSQGELILRGTFPFTGLCLSSDFTAYLYSLRRSETKKNVTSMYKGSLQEVEIELPAVTDFWVIGKGLEKGSKDETFIRIHSGCITGHVLGSDQCDCWDQYVKALRIIDKSINPGAVIYLPDHEGRGLGSDAKALIYKDAAEDIDTFESCDLHEFPHDIRVMDSVAAWIEAYEIKNFRLLTNNSEKEKRTLQMLSPEYAMGESIPLVVNITSDANPILRRYIGAKIKEGHHINLENQGENQNVLRRLRQMLLSKLVSLLDEDNLRLG